MKRKTLLLLGITATVMMFAAGCSANKDKTETTTKDETKIESSEATDEIKSDTTEIQEKETETEKTDEESDKTEENVDAPSYPDENPGYVQYDSPQHYSCSYDPTVFTLEDTADGDFFLYNTSEALKGPVYVTVMPHNDMTYEEVIEGAIIQTGNDKTKAEDTYFGSSNTLTKSFTVEKDINGVIQRQTFYFIPTEKGTLTVEIGGYDGMPENVEHALQHVADTFFYDGAEEVKTSPKTDDIEDTEEAEDTEIPENYEELQDNDLTQYSCDYFGFSYIYNENLFKVTSDDEEESIEYTLNEYLKAPVKIKFFPKDDVWYDDLMLEIVDEYESNNENDKEKESEDSKKNNKKSKDEKNLEPEEVMLGASESTALKFAITEEVDGVNVIKTYYAVQGLDGDAASSILIEVLSYEDMPKYAENDLNDLIDTLYFDDCY